MAAACANLPMTDRDLIYPLRLSFFRSSPQPDSERCVMTGRIDSQYWGLRGSEV